MKAIGIVRKIDSLGRVVLPKEIRKTFDLPEGAPIEIFTEDNTIILKKYERGCIFCGQSSDFMFGDQCICSDCREQIRKGLKELKIKTL